MSWVDKEKLMKHRLDMKLELLELLKENNKVAMVQPTGMGKSHMMIDLCNNLDGNKIIITPTKALSDKLNRSVNKSTNTFIYCNLLGLSNSGLENLFRNIDYLFLDEFHRTGADKWESKIKDIMKLYPDMKIIGLTATPTRTDGRDMVKELFDNVQTKPMNLLEAIEEHLLPQVKYITAFASLDKVIKCREDALKDSRLKYPNKKEYLDILKIERHKLESIYNIPNILRRNIDRETYIDNKNLKVLVFIPKIDMLNEASKEFKSYFKEAFPDKNINIYSISSKNRRSYINKQIKSFEDNKNVNDIDIMISINIFNEGFHINSVNCEIFLRKTGSEIIYTQQFGRVMSSENPIVFDLVSNYNSIPGKYDFDKFKKDIGGYKFSPTREDNRIDDPPIWIIDETKEVRDVLSKLYQGYLSYDIRENIRINGENKNIECIIKENNLPDTREYRDSVRLFCKRENINILTKLPCDTKEIKDEKKSLVLNNRELSISELYEICNHKYSKKAITDARQLYDPSNPNNRNRGFSSKHLKRVMRDKELMTKEDFAKKMNISLECLNFHIENSSVPIEWNYCI